MKRCGVMMLLVLASAAMGQESQPAATRDAMKRPAMDLSTPDKALESFFWAYGMSDGPAMADLTLWEDPKDFRRTMLLAPTGSMLLTMSAFVEMYQKAFPDEPDTKKMAEQLQAAQEKMEKDAGERLARVIGLGKLEKKVEGDLATFTPKEKGTPYKFKNVNGQWKMLPEFWNPSAGDMKGVQMEVSKLTWETITTEFEAFKADVLAKKYATGKEATAAWSVRARESVNKATKDFLEKRAKEGATTKP